MKRYIFLIFFLVACGPTNNGFDVKQVTLSEANANNIDAASSAEPCGCEYEPPEPIELLFSHKTWSRDSYSVIFEVKGSKQNIQTHHAFISPDCIADIERQKIIPATLEKKISGTCTPIYILPANYDPRCWTT